MAIAVASPLWVAAAPPVAPRILAAGGEYGGRLRTGGFELYTVRLRAGVYARLTVNQVGVDVQVRVRPPGGLPAETLDCFEHGGDPVSWIAAVSGDYLVAVRQAKPRAPPGSYRLRVEEIREFRPSDAPRMRAERLSSEVKALLADAGESSRRRALDLGSEALALWRSLSAPDLELLALIAIGDTHHSLGNYAEARGYYDKALPLSRGLSDRRAEGELLNNIGLGLWNLNDPEGALEKFGSALEIWESIRYRYGLAVAESNSGIIYWQSGAYDRAVIHYTRALELITAVRDIRGEGFVQNNLGVTYGSLGDYDKARRHLRRARLLFLGARERTGAGRALLTIGRLDLMLGRLTTARDRIISAMAEIRAVGDRQWEVDGHIALGQVHAKLGSSALAIAEFRRALDGTRVIGYLRGEATALHELGVSQTVIGTLDEATRSLEEALAMRRSLGLREAEADTLYRLARCQATRGNLEEARAASEASTNLTDALRTSIPGDQFRASYTAAHRERSAFLVRILMLLHQRKPDAGFDRQAIEASERARARGLLDLLGTARDSIRSGIREDLLERSQRLRRQINNESRLLFVEAARQKSARKGGLEALLAQYEETEAEIRADSPAYATIAAPQSASVQEIQSRLGLNADTVLIEYALGDEESYAWAITTRAVRSFVLPPRRRIEAAAKRFQAFFLAGHSDGSARSYSAAARELSELVLAPVELQLTSKRILIVADGALQYVPFAALPLTGARHDLLIDRNEIIRLPSASVLLYLRHEKTDLDAAGALAVIADPVYDSNDSRVTHRGRAENMRAGNDRFRRLMFSRKEALGAWSQAPSNSRMLALDFAASKGMLSDPVLRRYRIIHISSHGFFNNEQPELSGLVLSLVRKDGASLDGMIYLHDIFNLTLNADLIVLSACQSAFLGREAAGEGIVGLVRGFFYAGARRLIVSLWKVDDESTSELMSAFYRGLFAQARTSPSAAFRSAQLELRKSKRFRDPYYWAAFELQGAYE